MTKTELLEHVSNLSIWKRHEQRAPHKPLLILLYLGRLQANQPRMALFATIEKKLTTLLEEFGPLRKSHHPEEPFCRLQKDKIWELSIDLPAGVGAITKKALRTQKVAGGFTREVFELLKTEDLLIDQIATYLLQKHFQPTLHNDILGEVGLDIDFIEEIHNLKQRRRARDPQFRQRILQAYDFRCAICSFDMRLGKQPIALEAAHLKWFNHGGPDTVNNGMALCSLHHKLLDHGALAISHEYRILVSQKVTGYAGLQEWVLDFEGKPINQPRQSEYALETSFMDWHIKEVYKGLYSS